MSRMATHMSFLDCMKLIDKAVMAGVLQLDPARPHNILVWQRQSATQEAVLCSESIMEAARELSRNAEGQHVIMEALNARGVSTDEFNPIY